MKKIASSILGLCAFASAQAWDIKTSGSYDFMQVSDGVQVMHGPMGFPSPENHGFINNPGFIEGEDGIIVVDPGPSLYAGNEILKDIKKISNKPVVAVFVTHAHGDHWLGNHAIKEAFPNAKFYGHMNMIRESHEGEGARWVEVFNEMTDGKAKGTVPVIPGYSVGHGDTIKISGQTFVTHSPFPAAHSGADIMIEHKESKTLFAGDNLFAGRMGRFAGDSSMHDNIETLKYALELDVNTFVPGHGKSGDKKSTILPYLKYLSVIKDEVALGYEEDLADYEIKPVAHDKLSEFHSWIDYDSQMGKHIGKMLREIEDRDM